LLDFGVLEVAAVHLLDGDLGEPLAILQEYGHDAELAG
jgi:hypothetical protein